MAIVFKVEQPVESIGAEPGDLLVVDVDDPEYPISLVRPQPREKLIGVLRHLDRYTLLTPEASLSPLFGAVELEPPHHGHEQPGGVRPLPREGEAS